MMQSLLDIPTSTELPPIERLAPSRPHLWIGREITWSSDALPPAVLIAILDVPGAGECLLFGFKHDLADALVGGKSFGHGHFIEYVIAQKEHGATWTVHRLVQQRSVTYTTSMEAKDYVDASKVKDVGAHCLGEQPRWRWNDANWPTHDGQPMTFVAQFDLPDCELTRKLLTVDVRVLLFMSIVQGHAVFKIMEEQIKTQSAEEHYALEDSIDRPAGARRRSKRPKSSE
jgi:hypothetical protein